MSPVAARDESELEPGGGVGKGAVATFGSDTADLRTIPLESLAFGPDGAPPLPIAAGPLAFERDLNGDGWTDLLVLFSIRRVGFALDDEEACLVAIRIW